MQCTAAWQSWVPLKCIAQYLCQYKSVGLSLLAFGMLEVKSEAKEARPGTPISEGRSGVVQATGSADLRDARQMTCRSGSLSCAG